ncbi:MAG: 16S rRNA (cytosine(967)-C(5))-methyltransferase RsmB [Deltaproteobacteria bacterium]|nr:16S rRNA (cytosine(967)-C(5))-methyltransferase RsmB [Deltaproteobacteria bacterium]
MKKSTPRDLALKILDRQLKDFDFSSNLLDNHFRQNTHFDERDKAFTSHLVQGVMRWRLRLDWTVEQFSDFPVKRIDSQVLNIIRLALYQIFFLDRVPESAAVNEAVRQVRRLRYGRHIASFVNGILRSICRGKDKITFPDNSADTAHYLSVYYSYPEWLVQKWIAEFGQDLAECLLDSQNRVPDLNIRVNILKITRDKLIQLLARDGLSAESASYSPEGIILKGIRGRVDRLDTFRQGFFQVQDQAAQIISHLVAPPPGGAVLDICAGQGGKSTHLAELMGDQGHVLALDISHRRLVNLVQNASRLGVKSIFPVVGDGSEELSSIFQNRFDRILVDAPCSGLGVLSRHPDGKWNRDEKSIRRLCRLQKKILNQAVSALKKGGRMLYVTCTISRAENEANVEEFLKGNSIVRLENLKDHVPGWAVGLINDQGFFRTYPHIHNMDGFFAALFIKI